MLTAKEAREEVETSALNRIQKWHDEAENKISEAIKEGRYCVAVPCFLPDKEREAIEDCLKELGYRVERQGVYIGGGVNLYINWSDEDAHD